jgi:hypothetical protein
MTKLLTGAVLLACAFASAGAFAQSSRPYKEGVVTDVTFVRTKDGHFEDYMKFLDGPYKQLMDAQKKAGLVVDYHVFTTEPRGPHDPDLLLSTTYANMAALDRVEEAIAISEKVAGSIATQEKGAADRGAIREILGSQLMRELVLK